MKTRALVASTAALMLLAPTALAHAAPPRPAATNLAGPLHLSVGPGKAVTVSESFASKLTRVDRKGRSAVIYSAPDWSVEGSEYRGSTLYFVESQGAGPEDQRPLAGSLKAINAKGKVSTITDQLGAYERSANPDQAVSYGLSASDAAANPECVAQMTAIGFPASYTGADNVDSHPYAVEVVGNTGYIADAGMNAVLSVNLKTGAIDTIAVLPSRPAVITAAAAETFGLPACEGLTYRFEAVPTDVEVGPDGWLYVSSLPGGPEDASLGARGAIFRVNPATGATRLRIDGLLTPTGIALDGNGNIYVASLFGQGIYKIRSGSTTANLFLAAQNAAAVEISGSTLYATTQAFGNGTLVSKRL